MATLKTGLTLAEAITQALSGIGAGGVLMATQGGGVEGVPGHPYHPGVYGTGPGGEGFPLRGLHGLRFQYNNDEQNKILARLQKALGLDNRFDPSTQSGYNIREAQRIYNVYRALAPQHLKIFLDRDPTLTPEEIYKLENPDPLGEFKQEEEKKEGDEGDEGDEGIGLGPPADIVNDLTREFARQMNFEGLDDGDEELEKWITEQIGIEGGLPQPDAGGRRQQILDLLDKIGNLKDHPNIQKINENIQQLKNIVEVPNRIKANIKEISAGLTALGALVGVGEAIGEAVAGDAVAGAKTEGGAVPVPAPEPTPVPTGSPADPNVPDTRVFVGGIDGISRIPIKTEFNWKPLQPRILSKIVDTVNTTITDADQAKIVRDAFTLQHDDDYIYRADTLHQLVDMHDSALVDNNIVQVNGVDDVTAIGRDDAPKEIYNLNDADFSNNQTRRMNVRILDVDYGGMSNFANVSQSITNTDVKETSDEIYKEFQSLHALNKLGDTVSVIESDNVKVHSLETTGENKASLFVNQYEEHGFSQKDKPANFKLVGKYNDTYDQLRAPQYRTKQRF